MKVTYEQTEKEVKGTKGGDVKALEKVKELYGKARKYAEEFDFETANAELDLCLNQLKDLRDFPEGVGPKSRAQLVKLAADWLKLTNTFEERIKEVAKTAVKRGREAKVDETELALVTTELDELASRVTTECSVAGQTFKSCFDALQMKPPQQECLKLREEALRAVRAIRKTLRNDPLLGMIRSNPFTPVEVHWAMEKALTDIELNATLAV
jgi:hypothetical protein